MLRGLSLAGRDLSGADLSAAILVDVDLSGANLSGVDLSDAELDRAKLVGANLAGAVLLRARGDDVDLSRANLTGASLVNAVFNRAVLIGADLCRVDGDQVRLEGVDAAEADFRRARLTGAEMGEGALSGARFNDADLSGARLEGARARGADFSGATLLKARLDGADLTDAVLEGADLRRAVLSRAQLSGVEVGALRAGGAVARRLEGASPALMALLEAEGAKLAPGFLGQLIEGLKKRRVESDLRKADIAGLEAIEVAPEPSEIPEPAAAPDVVAAADSADEPVEDTAEDPAEDPAAVAAVPEAAEVKAPAEAAPTLAADAAVEAPPAVGDAEDTSAPTPSAEIADEIADTLADEPAGPGLLGRLSSAFGRAQRPEADELVPGSDLSGRDLRRVRLAGLDLSGANLSDCRLDGADLSGADLSGARLERARLSGADLTGANAARARFDDAVLRRADLTGLDASEASFIGARFSEAVFAGACFVGADLSAALLADVDLADADLSRALMEQADLAGADLSRVVVTDAEVDGALGLSAETLDELEARGARVGRFSLGRVAAALGTARLFQGAAALITVSLVGYLGYRFIGERNLDATAIEVEVGTLSASGEIEAALEGYEELIELAEWPVDRVTYRFEMAALLVEDQRPDEAMAALEAAIEDANGEPELHAEARLYYARLLADMGQPKRAAGIYEGLTEEDASPAILAQALVGLSGAYADMDQRDEAIAIQKDVLERYPNNPGLVVSLNISMAELFSAAGEYEEALASLEHIESYPLEDDQRAALMVARARTYESLGDPGQALDTYKALFARYPTHDEVSGEILLSMATLFAREQDVGEARELLTQLASKGGSPTVLARGLLLQARLDEDGGDADAAQRGYTAVIERYPDDRDALETARLGLARILLSENPDADVLSELPGGSEDGELAAQVLLGQAQRREDVGDVEAAALLYQRVIDEFPDAAGARDTARFRKAALLASAESYAEAINAYRELLGEATDQDTKTVLEAAMAEAYLMVGRIGDAEQTYTSLLIGAPEDSEAAGLANIGLGRVAEARGQVEGARRRYQKVIDEVSDPALKSSALQALADSYLDAGRDDEAMAAYSRFLSTLPEGHDASFTTRRAIAGILERRGENGRALTLYEALIEDDPNPERRIEVELARAELLETRGDPASARAAYQELLDGRGMDVASREDAVLGLCRSTLQMGQLEEALALADRYQERFETPNSQASLMQLRAQALRGLGRIQEAEALSEQILALSGEGGDAAFSAMMERANARMNEGEFDEAITIYSALLEEVEDRPTAAALENSIAQVRMASGDLDGAAVAFEAVAESYSGLAEARFSAGMGLADVDMARGEPERAVTRYGSLEAPDAGSEVWRLSQLASATLASGDDDGAADIFRALIQDHASDATALAAGRMGLADLLHANDEFEPARGLYQRVARESPDPTQREWAALRVANTYADEGSLEQALESLGSLTADAADPEVQLQARLGQSAILLEQDKAREALTLLEGVDAGPLGPAWVASLVQQQVACLTVLGERGEAREAWRGVLERWGELDDAASLARLGLGDLSVDEGKYDKALGWYGEVLSESGDRHYQARAVLGQAGAWRTSGDTDKAREAFSRLVEEYPDQDELVATANRELARLSN